MVGRCLGLLRAAANTPSALTALAACAAATVLFLALTYRARPYLAFVLPPLMLYTLLIVYPAVAAFRYSLYDWSGFSESRSCPNRASPGCAPTRGRPCPGAR